jgi:hypothetical protein
MSQCGACRRFVSPFDEAAPPGVDGPTCEAFPRGIPDEVYENRLDHRRPIDGDHGVRFAARDGATFPEYALATG